MYNVLNCSQQTRVIKAATAHGSREGLAVQLSCTMCYKFRHTVFTTAGGVVTRNYKREEGLTVFTAGGVTRYYKREEGSLVSTTAGVTRDYKREDVFYLYL